MAGLIGMNWMFFGEDLFLPLLFFLLFEGTVGWRRRVEAILHLIMAGRGCASHPTIYINTAAFICLGFIAVLHGGTSPDCLRWRGSWVMSCRGCHRMLINALACAVECSLTTVSLLILKPWALLIVLETKLEKEPVFFLSCSFCDVIKATYV